MLLKKKPSQEISTTNVGKCSKLFTVRSWVTQHYLKVLCSNFSYENYNFYNFFGKFCFIIVAKCSKPSTSFCQLLLGSQHFLTQFEAIFTTHLQFSQFCFSNVAKCSKLCINFLMHLSFFALNLACGSNSTTSLAEDQIFFILKYVPWQNIQILLVVLLQYD